MSEKKYSLTPTAKKIKPIDVTGGLWPLFWWAFAISIIMIGSVMSLLLSTIQRLDGVYCLFLFLYVVFAWLVTIFSALGLMAYIKYGTKQCLVCAFLLKVIEGDYKYKRFLARCLFNFIWIMYLFLGKYTSSEDVEGGCYTLERYQKFIGHGKRGLVAQQVEFLKNTSFYHGAAPHYSTRRRLFNELAYRGRNHFITQEHLEKQ